MIGWNNDGNHVPGDIQSSIVAFDLEGMTLEVEGPLVTIKNIEIENDCLKADV